MIRFVYPNVSGNDEFIGCGRYLTISPDNPNIDEKEPADPQVRGLAKISSGVHILAPESDESEQEVYEDKDSSSSFRGDSLGLAYLLALIKRSRITIWEPTDQIIDIWCTGTIDVVGNSPQVGEVFPNQFAVKIEAFFADSNDTLFIVPFVNLKPKLKKRCRDHHVRVVTLARFTTLPVQEHFTQKTILQLHGDELKTFVEFIFQRPEEGIVISEPEIVISWNDAPTPLQIWTGRKDLLREISADWTDPNCHAIGLIGFGGEGKSSVARRWIDELREEKRSHIPKPAAAFWWNFYSSPNVDKFFEAVFTFMTEGEVNPNDYPSTSAKAKFLAGMLHSKCYLLILDGMEVIQYHEGKRYGQLKNADLRQFLLSLAASSSRSFCLITSRLPVGDLKDFRSYIHCDVTRLKLDDGRTLLRKIGVKGGDSDLDQVVTDWDGHALTLCLLASYLVDRYRGNVKHIKKIPPPLANEPRYERVNRMLRLYDNDLLTDAERAFLMIFSAFRIPVQETAFASVFRTKTSKADQVTGLFAPVAALKSSDFEKLLQRLQTYSILRGDKHYTIHPLIRDYYLKLLNNNAPDQVQEVHQRIKNYYLSVAGEMPENPTLEELTPLIEAEHHACLAGKYDEAHRIMQEDINLGNRYLVPDVLCAWDTYLALLFEFFPDGDTSREPQTGFPETKASILNEVGFSLMMLGRLSEVEPFYARPIKIWLDMENWWRASRSYHNLVELYAYFGELNKSEEAAREALNLARRAKNREEERISLADLAWILHLRGNLREADEAFQNAEKLQREMEPQILYLYQQLEGIGHADYLRRTGNTVYARQIIEANLNISKCEGWQDYTSLSYRVLGDLDADAGRDDRARTHYNEALMIARNIPRRDVLIEVLISRGRWAARNLQDAPAALIDLNEALDYAVNEGYRIYEADIRVALAWAYLTEACNTSPAIKTTSLEKAKLEISRARRMSENVGYYWGKVDAEEVIRKLEELERDDRNEE